MHPQTQRPRTIPNHRLNEKTINTAFFFEKGAGNTGRRITMFQHASTRLCILTPPTSRTTCAAHAILGTSLPAPAMSSAGSP